ncbi:MAG: ribonuclease III [Ruminococcus sp.]|nr:ribonuclease III [Ruminococcus sp.]
MSFKALDKKEVGQYSPTALAFMGDSVYEQLVREKLILSANMPAGKLHSLTVKYVCCEFQSAVSEKILPLLSEEESDIFRRGRNAGGITPPKHSSVREYRTATALECLFGYLYLTGQQERVRELFEIIWTNQDSALN